MTKPAAPPPPRAANIVEIDAMDVAEWESGQRTPQASDANLAELVRRSAAPPEPRTRPQTVARERARTELGVPIVARPASQPARTAPPGPAPKPTRARPPAGGPPHAPARPASGAPASSRPTPGPAASQVEGKTGAPASSRPTPGPAASQVEAKTGAPAPPRQTPRAPAPPARDGLAARREIAMLELAPLRPVAPLPLPPVPPARSGFDFSVPVTATSELPVTNAAAASAAPAARGTDFSLPVTATSDLTALRQVPPPPAATARGGTDFSLPVTSEQAKPQPAPRMPAPAPAAREIDFSLPVTATSELTALRQAPRPASEPRGDSAPPAAATSESGARPPEVEPLPAAMASAFAEPSRVGPGTISSTAGGADPNTAWPPRPIPSGLSSPDAALRHGAIRDPAAEGSDQLQVLTRRRLWWIGGAVGSIAVGVVIAAALINPSDTPSDQSPDSASERSAPGPGRGPRGPRRVREVAAAPARPAAAATPARKPPAPRSPPAAEMPAARSTPPGRSLAVAAAPPSAPARPGPHAAKKLITKKLVVDYSSRPSDPAPPGLVAQTEEDPAIGKARGAYTTGNQKLFAGDLDGAIHSYHQALELYPGYVGGYRGLGLAYAQLGDTASALEALTTYIEAVPAARDAALIRKRIARLQAR